MKKNFFSFEKFEKIWTRVYKVLFSIFFFCILGFALWTWYGIVYHPNDRVAEIKKKILEQSDQKKFNEKQLEEVLQKLEDQTQSTSEVRNGRNLFY